jgi:hypothetical protein
MVEALVNQMTCEGIVPTLARLEEHLVGIPKTFLFQHRSVCKQLCELAMAKPHVLIAPTPREKEGLLDGC